MARGRVLKTKKKKELPEAHEVLSLLFDPVVLFDSEGLVSFINRAGEELFGFEKDEVLGKPLPLLLDTAEAAAHVEESLREHGFWDGNLHFRKKDGHLLLRTCRGRALKTGRGEPHGFFLMLSRLPPRRRADTEIRRLEYTLDTIGEGVAVNDLEGKIIYVNRALETMTGYRSGELLGKPVEMIHAPENSPGLKERIFSQTLSHGFWQGELTYLGKSGNCFPVWLSTNVLRRRSGEVAALVGVARDITEMKRMQRQLIHSERLSAIGEMAARVAHEIRNPLGAIQNCVGLLKRDLTLSEDDRNLMGIVTEEVARLNRIVADFLAFSKPRRYAFDATNLEEILKSTILLIRKGGKTKGSDVSFLLDVGKGAEEVWGDSDHLYQVFLNILINAVEAMPEGGEVTVSLRRTELAGEPAVLAEVRDEGKGISPSMLENVFEPFQTTKRDGTGLGLAIVYRVVEDHGGKVEIQSRPGEGTTVRVLLPARLEEG